MIDKLRQEKEDKEDPEAKQNIPSSLNLHILDINSHIRSKQKLLFSIFPDKPDESTELKEFKQVLDGDNKTEIIKKDASGYKITFDWFNQVNNVNPAGITEFCGYFNFNESLFRKRLKLRKHELIIVDEKSNKTTILLNYNQIQKMEKIALFVGSPITRMENEICISYQISTEWFRKLSRSNPEGLENFCLNLGLNQEEVLQGIGKKFSSSGSCGNRGIM